MKVIVQRGALLRALDCLGDLASTRQILEFAAGTVLRLHDNRLVLEATDTQVWVKTEVSAEVLDGEVPNVGLDGKLFRQLVERIDTKTVEIDTRETNAHIRAGDNQYRLRTFDADSFPERPEAATPFSLKVRFEVVKAISSYLHYIPPNESLHKPYLEGIYLQFSPGHLKAFATDSLRVGMFKAPYPQAIGALGVIMPKKAVESLTVLQLDPEDLVTVHVGQNCLHIIACHTEITTNLLHGQYPRLEGVFPNLPPHSKVEVGKEFLLRALDRLLLFAKVYGNAPTTISLSADGLAMRCEVAEMGDVEEKIPILGCSGEPFDLTVNGKFVVDVLKSPISDPIEICYFGDRTPLLIKSTQGAFQYWMFPLSEV